MDDNERLLIAPGSKTYKNPVLYQILYNQTDYKTLKIHNKFTSMSTSVFRILEV